MVGRHRVDLPDRTHWGELRGGHQTSSSAAVGAVAPPLALPLPAFVIGVSGVGQCCFDQG